MFATVFFFFFFFFFLFIFFLSVHIKNVKIKISQFLLVYYLLLHSKEGNWTMGRIGYPVALHCALCKIYTE